MFLIDTNVLSDAYRKHEKPLHWLSTAVPESVFVSVISVGEIERGIAMKRRNDEVAALSLETWLTALRGNYSDRFLPVTEEVAVVWGRLSAGRTRGTPDGLIAATALANRLTLVTRNTKDFYDTGVEILDPWSL